MISSPALQKPLQLLKGYFNFIGWHRLAVLVVTTTLFSILVGNLLIKEAEQATYICHIHF
jgi:hypothetical protein